MTFECKGCNEKVSNSTMAGLVVGQIAKATLESKGIKTESGLRSAINGGDFSAGVLTGLRIKCPNCDKSNWS